MEKWKTLIYNDKLYYNYKISNEGRVKNIDTGRILSSRTNKIQPHIFTEIFWFNDSISTRKSIYIHKAVAEAFVKNPKAKLYVSHKNNDYLDNTPNNLYWVTHSELQIRNMRNNPAARNRLRDINIKSGYYNNVGTNNALTSAIISRIKKYTRIGRNAKYIAATLNISLSSVYKYK